MVIGFRFDIYDRISRNSYQIINVLLLIINIAILSWTYLVWLSVIRDGGSGCWLLDARPLVGVERIFRHDVIESLLIPMLNIDFNVLNVSLLPPWEAFLSNIITRFILISFAAFGRSMIHEPIITHSEVHSIIGTMLSISLTLPNALVHLQECLEKLISFNVDPLRSFKPWLVFPFEWIESFF